MKKNIIIIALACVVVILTVVLLINYKDKIGLVDTKIDKTKLAVYIVNDSRCNECMQAISSIKLQIESLFPEIEFKEYDYSKSDGKNFYNEYKLEELPVMMFTEAVKSHINYPEVQNYLSSNLTDPTLFLLNIGSTFDPTREICDNQQDDTGNGKVDCDDPDCAGSLVCREERAGKLDLFVMSQCPYGTRALDSMKEVLENFKDKIDFQIYYIAEEVSDGVFKSLHGQPEVDENIRGLCAIKHYPDNYKYMDYIWCVNKEIEKDYSNYNWETCAKDFPKIKTCFTGDEGKKLLSENVKLANDLQIGASPTWIANNKYEFSGIDSETIKINFCRYNTDLGDMCANTLSYDSAVSGSCD